MNSFLKIIPLLIVVLIPSCGQEDPNKQVDQGTVRENIYTNEELGWTINIPKNWKVYSKDKRHVYTGQAIAAIEKVNGTVDTSGLEFLISFKKDNFNVLLSSSFPYSIEVDGVWRDFISSQKNVLYAVYVNEDFLLDTMSSKAKIDDISFDVFHVRINLPNGKVFLYQDAYWALINEHFFEVVLNYNNETNKETLMDVWTNSKFIK